jgi:hypothetical protein
MEGLGKVASEPCDALFARDGASAQDPLREDDLVERIDT